MSDTRRAGSSPVARRRVLFVWWTFESYLGACWRELAKNPAVELVLIAKAPEADSLAPHDPAVLRGVEHRLLPRADMLRAELLRLQIREFCPDVIVIPGWTNPGAIKAVMSKEFADVKLIMAMDTPWTGSLRQRLGRFRYPGLFKRVDLAVVAGERARVLAMELGIPPGRVRRGMYGVDYAALSAARQSRPISPESWPRRFGFVGRYVESKGVAELAQAYRRYCEHVTEAWTLECCGLGPLSSMLKDAGAIDHGFVPAERLGEMLTRFGVFVLPSRWDPWPLALVEAGASGLPLITTSGAGSAVENVQTFFNGLIVPPSDPEQLARAMLWMHQNQARLLEMGARSASLAAAYSAEAWARRWGAYIAEFSE